MSALEADEAVSNSLIILALHIMAFYLLELSGIVFCGA
jgi:hypothetical protein